MTASAQSQRPKEVNMRSVLKSTFLWQFAGGFLLGAIGMVTLQPTGAVADTLGISAQADR